MSFYPTPSMAVIRAVDEKVDPLEMGAEQAAERAIWGAMIGAGLDVAVLLVTAGPVSLVAALTGPFAIFFTVVGAAHGYFRGRRIAREINASQ